MDVFVYLCVVCMFVRECKCVCICVFCDGVICLVYAGLELTTSLRQTSIRTDKMISNPTILIIAHI
jgi:hypothetical protein